MTRARSRIRAGAVIAAVAVSLLVVSPTLLTGRSPSAFGLVLIGTLLVGVGLGVRWSGTRARTVGSGLLIVGAVVLALGVGLTALVVAGWRGY